MSPISKEINSNIFTGSVEYLYVARTETVDLETRSHDLDEQLNRGFVASGIGRALEALKTNNNRDVSVKFLKQAYEKIQHSETKGKFMKCYECTF